MCRISPRQARSFCFGKRTQNHLPPGRPHSIVLMQATEGRPNSPGSDKGHPLDLIVSPVGRSAGAIIKYSHQCLSTVSLHGCPILTPKAWRPSHLYNTGRGVIGFVYFSLHNNGRPLRDASCKRSAAGPRPGSTRKQWDPTAVHAGHYYLFPRLSFPTVHFDWTTSPSVDG